MNKYISTGIDFLNNYGMDSDQFDIDEGCTSFLTEMENGLSGKDSSLMMIPTYIDPEKSIPVGEPVIVLDAGGTNFRVATISFNTSGVADISRYKKFPMPGTGVEGAVGKAEFFDRISGFMEESVSDSKRIGFCFSYPTEIFPSGDGRLVYFAKEVKAPEVEGCIIGENLLDALARRGITDKKDLVILNDTVATLLAGKAQKKEYDSYIGFILGTGTNCSYIEQNKNIGKVKGLDASRSQTINTESGRFAKFEGGKLDAEFLAKTDKPDTGRFEKMISGAYQGPLTLHVIERAALDGLFSEKLTEGIMGMSELPPSVADGFLLYPRNLTNPISKICDSDSDLTILFTIMDRLIERAARLTAAHLAAFVLKTGKGKDPTFPVCIAADGTTYYKTKGLKFRTEYYLKGYLENTMGRYAEFCHLDDAPLIGAAVAGLIHNRK